jgi:hypothetical protein
VVAVYQSGMRSRGDLRRKARIFPWPTTPLAASPPRLRHRVANFGRRQTELPLVLETVEKLGMVVAGPNLDRKPERLRGRESASCKVGL